MLKERILWIVPLIGLGIFLVQQVRPKTEEDTKFDWKRLWIYKTHSDTRYNCLVTGDSRIYRGISADAIKKELPGRLSVFNFGYSSGSYSTFMLNIIEKKMDFNSDELILLMGITPYSLTPRAKDGHIKQELARKKEEIIEYLYLEPIKRLFEPMSMASLTMNPKSNIGTPEVPYYHQECYYREGWVASWKSPPDPKAALAEYVKDFDQNQISQERIDTLMERIARWTEKGVKVYGFRPPTTPEMVELENRLSSFNEQQFVERFHRAGGKWFSIDSREYSSYDGSHLEKVSAIRLSTDLGKLLRNQLKAF